jgi:hypothetical protein
MRIFLYVVTLVFSSSLLAKEQLIICPALYYSSVKKVVEANGSHDKFKHCAVSCLLTLRCPAADVLELGIIKELADVVGPGNAEMADLQADYHGVKLGSIFRASDKSCLTQCHLAYPENSCQ